MAGDADVLSDVDHQVGNSEILAPWKQVDRRRIPSRCAEVDSIPRDRQTDGRAAR